MTGTALQLAGIAATITALVILVGPWITLLIAGLLTTFVGIGVERAKMERTGRR